MKPRRPPTPLALGNTHATPTRVGCCNPAAVRCGAVRCAVIFPCPCAPRWMVAGWWLVGGVVRGRGRGGAGGVGGIVSQEVTTPPLLLVLGLVR
jgi:hypothetical protein